jgi:hypothetical protein
VYSFIYRYRSFFLRGRPVDEASGLEGLVEVREQGCCCHKISSQPCLLRSFFSPSGKFSPFRQARAISIPGGVLHVVWCFAASSDREVSTCECISVPIISSFPRRLHSLPSRGIVSVSRQSSRTLTAFGIAVT